MEKQIEEMARLICWNFDTERGMCCEGTECNHDCWAYREATHLHKAGYRKQAEAEWIYHEAVITDEGLISVYGCSKCNACVNEDVFDTDEFHKNYCGNCGAKMKGN